MNLLVHFVIYGHSCNFENFQNITRAHKSRNALAFIRFPILIHLYRVLEIQQSFSLLFVVQLRGIIFFRQLTVDE